MPQYADFSRLLYVKWGFDTISPFRLSLTFPTGLNSNEIVSIILVKLQHK